jgi:predicted esterase YcpF (UPF0227 family)
MRGLCFYLNSFPMPPLIYIHGFNSSPRSHKANLLLARMQALGLGGQLLIPALPADPSRAMQVLEQALAELPGRSACLVGSSLGGYYATWLAERHRLRAVLLNPAVTPYELLLDYLGDNENPYTGERYRITESDIDVLKGFDVERLSHPENFLVYVETGDEVLDYRQAVEKFAKAELVVFPGGSHEMVNFESVIDDILVYCGYSP